jgi:hypothetical protein
LAQVGFTAAESHGEPVPLVSWRGTPLGGEAEVVVRREQIGAAGDDFGFVRNSSGSYDAVISEIHLFRFDRRWLEDLARRHDELVRADGLTAPRGLPNWGRRDLGPAGTPAPPAAPSLTAMRAARSGASDEQDATRARVETAAAVDALRKRQKKWEGPGCIFSLVAPTLLWLVLGGVEPELRGAAGFFGIAMPIFIGFAVFRGIRFTRRTRRAADALMERIPSGEHARAAARSYLEAKLKPAGAKTEDPVVKELMKALRESKR